MAPIFEVKSLQHAYADQTVLDIDRLRIDQSAIVGLIGPNGSGKSTLLRVLGLIEKPSRGQIRFEGRPVEPFSPGARFQISMLPQEPFLMKRSVYKNVAYGLKLKGVKKKEIAGLVSSSLAKVGLAGDHFSRRSWYALSGGEAQRVALAARLALKPKVLLMDEPTASVDAASAQLIKEAAQQTRRELGTTLIVASHDWQWLFEVCDTILHLSKGKVFGTGREALIFGPWIQLDSGKWGKQLADRQVLWVSEPPDQAATAVIDTFEILEAGEGGLASGAVLHGTVIRLSLQKKTNRVFATILAGDLPFTLALTPMQTSQPSLYPGKTVCIHYQPQQIKWI